MIVADRDDAVGGVHAGRCSLSRLQDLGIRDAAYVPTGFGPSLRRSGAALPEHRKRTPVGFVGRRV